jgi:hypothetical protein
MGCYGSFNHSLNFLCLTLSEIAKLIGVLNQLAGWLEFSDFVASMPLAAMLATGCYLH